MFQKLHNTVGKCAQTLQRFVDRFWYPPLLIFLSACDNLVIFIPNDGILVSSSILKPKRWFTFALCISIGSTIGAMVLIYIVETHGLSVLDKFFPSFQSTTSWKLTHQFFEQYGLYLLFFVSITPFSQQPAVILAALTQTPLLHLTAIIFVGRFLKFLAMAYIGSHAPKLLGKLWGLQGELKEVGIDTKD